MKRFKAKQGLTQQTVFVKPVSSTLVSSILLEKSPWFSLRLGLCLSKFSQPVHIYTLSLNEVLFSYFSACSHPSLFERKNIKGF
jgi:hypothetical protein